MQPPDHRVQAEQKSSIKRMSAVHVFGLHPGLDLGRRQVGDDPRFFKRNHLHLNAARGTKRHERFSPPHHQERVGLDCDLCVLGQIVTLVSPA
jgi:hypothetical protein